MNDELDGMAPHAGARRNYWSIAVRRRWMLMLPLFFCGLAGYGMTRLRPPSYRSSAMILVEQQYIPDRYVAPNVIVNLQQRLDSMTQQILGRSRLQRLIEDLQLYERERQRGGMDAVVDLMRESIQVEVMVTPGRAGELTGFKVGYTGATPSLAQRVTNELVSIFIDENIRSRTQQSTGTTAFLREQLDQARKSVDEQEARLREYKGRYTGELPEQQAANLQVLASLEAQLFANTASLERAEQQKVYLESLRAQYGAMQNVTSQGASDESAGTFILANSDSTLRDLQKKVIELKAQYLPNHPDLVKAQQELNEWVAMQKRAQDDASKQQPVDPKPQSSPPTTIRTRSQPLDTAMIETEGRLKATQVEIESLSADAQKLRSRIQEYHNRVSAAPLRQQQLSEVVRSYDNAVGNYQSLLKKNQESELASNFEMHQQGERLRLLDAATLPRKPESRMAISAMGWVLGLIVGIGLVVMRESADQSVRDLREVTAETNAAFIVRLPIIRGPGELRRHRWQKGLEAFALVALLVLFVGTNIQVYAGK